MSQVSAAFSKQTIQKMRVHYKDCLKTTPSHAIFQAKTPNAVITAYQSGKVLFQGKAPENEAAKWQVNVSSSTAKKKDNIQKEMPDFLQTSHIGSDESGTGDYFGPITTCAAFVHKDQIALLKEIGVQDSKNLTDEKIKELSRYIVAMDIPYSLMIIHNDKYNDLQSRGWSQGKMKTMLHDACIKNVLAKINGKISYNGILIDQFCQPDVYRKHLASEGKAFPPHVHFMTKAESYSIAVATASVIARASFVKEMERLSEITGTQLVKGASRKVDRQAAQLIRKHGKDFLYQVAKVHFATTEKAESLV